MSRLPWLALLPPLVFLALAATFFFGLRRDDPEGLPSARAGQPAPEIALEPLGDKPLFTPEALTEDGVKLVNFWASWCAPCRVEHPNLEKIAQAQGVPIYGVNYKDDADKALGFLQELGDPYAAIGADPSGRGGIEWGLYGVPETYVIDGQGRIVLRFAGPITERALDRDILPAIEKARTAR